MVALYQLYWSTTWLIFGFHRIYSVFPPLYYPLLPVIVFFTISFGFRFWHSSEVDKVSRLNVELFKQKNKNGFRLSKKKKNKNPGTRVTPTRGDGFQPRPDSPHSHSVIHKRWKTMLKIDGQTARIHIRLFTNIWNNVENYRDYIFLWVLQR